MNLSQQLINKIQYVLDSDMTSYRIAKDVGYANANQIYALRKNEVKINGLGFDKVIKFEEVYEELQK